MVAGQYLKQYWLAGYYSKDWELDILLVLNSVWEILRVVFYKRQKELDGMVKTIKLHEVDTSPLRSLLYSDVPSENSEQATDGLLLNVFQLSVIVLEHLNKCSSPVDWSFPGQKFMKKLYWAENKSVFSTIQYNGITFFKRVFVPSF